MIDLDGVVWLAGDPIPGAASAVSALRQRGNDVLFATNNSAPTTAELLARLSRIGIAADLGDLVTSAQAAAAVIPGGSRVLALGDEGLREALSARDVTVVDVGPADAVVVGWTKRFDFDLMSRAMTALRGGALLIGTNDDPTHPTPDGLLPGSGALLAAVATASGKRPVVAGKPHDPFLSLVSDAAAKRGGEIVAMVGDRPSTDGAMARRLAVPFALVLSGVTRRSTAGVGGIPAGDAPPAGVPDAVAEDLATLVDAVLHDRR
ncbi:MAG: HAD-IIA family hydrolase [Acidimicrobiales bacterium]